MANESRPMTLHVLVSDRDVAFARHLLRHQVEVLGPMCSEVLLVVNRPPSAVRTAELDAIVEEACGLHPEVRVHEVAYSDAAIRNVSDRYFGGERYPLFDFKGVPIHAYLDSYWAAANDVLFHTPSDMLYGGSPDGWADAVLAAFALADPPLVVSPAGGSPHAGAYTSGGVDVSAAFPDAAPVYRLEKFAGRCHAINVPQFTASVSPIPLAPPVRLADRVITAAGGLPQVDHLEGLLDRQMAKGGHYRLDISGPGGLWTLHPIYKSPRFVELLPDLIAMARSGDVPTGQVGHFDLIDEFDPSPGMSRADRLVKALRGRRGRPRPLWSTGR